MKIINLFDDLYEMLVYRKNPNKKNGYDLDLETLPEADKKPYKIYRGNEWYLTPIPFLTEKISISEKPVSNLKSNSLRKPSLVISLSRNTELGTRHFTGIYIEADNPDFGYGDIRDTHDLLLFRLFQDESNTECFEMVYCPGKLKLAFHYLKEYIKLYHSKAA